MNRSILSFVTALMMVPASLMAQTYTALWAQDKAAESKDLPKTRLEVLSKIAAKAESEKAYGQLLKANLLSAKVTTSVSPDSLLPAVNMMRQQEQAAGDDVLKAVYNAVLYRIYKDNAQHLGDGADTVAARFRERAMAAPAKLAAAHATDFEPLVERGLNAAVFGSDMLSVVGYEVEDFMTLWHWYKDAGRRQAACISALELLRQYKPTGSKGLRQSEYINSLDSIIHVYQDLDVACEAAIERYDYMQTCPDVTVEDRIGFIRRAIDKWGGWQKADYLRNAERELTASHYQAVIDRNRVTPGTAQTVRLQELRNVTSLTMNVYRAAVDGSYSGSPRNDRQYRELKPLLTALPDKRVTRTFVNRPDYQLFDDSLVIGPLPTGVYMIEYQTVPASQTVRDMYYVSDVYCMAHPLPGDSVRYVVVSATTGQPLPGAKVRVEGYGRYKGNPVTLTCDARGEAVAKTGKDGAGKQVFAYTDNDKAAPAWNSYMRYSYNAGNQRDEQTSVFTDRGIYRPGQTVHVAAVVYRPEGETGHKAVAGKTVKAALRDANYKVVEERDITTDAFGTCSTDFTLPAGTLNGVFSVTVNGNIGTFRVEEYKRPTFRVEFPELNEKYRDGDTLMVRAKAVTYAGVPVQDAEVTYSVRRTMSLWWRNSSMYAGKTLPGYGLSGETVFTGTARTGADGVFTVEVPVCLPEEAAANRRVPMFYNFVVEADVTDMGGETRTGSMSIPLGNRTTMLTSDLPRQVQADSLGGITFRLNNAAGINIAADVRFSIDGSGEWLTAKTAQRFLFTEPLASGRHNIVAVCEGDTLEDSFVVFGLDDRVPATDTPDWFFISHDAFPADGRPVTLQVGSADKDVHVVYSIVAGNSVIEMGSTDISNALINRKFTYRDEYGNGLRMVFAWVKNGEIYSHEVSVRRPVPDKKLKMMWTTFRDRLTPGQQEEWRMTVLNPDGTPAAAQLMATLYDKSLDQIAANNWSFAPSRWYSLPFMPLLSSSHNMLILSGTAPWKSRTWKEFAPSRFDASLFPGSYHFTHRRYNTYLTSSMSRGMKGAEDIVMADVEMSANGVADAKMMIRGTGMAAAQKKEAATDTAVTEEAAYGEDTDGGADEYGVTEVSLRENMSETAFFYPALMADSTGNITLAFTLPESLTTWRFMGMAHTADMLSGIIGGEAVARKDVMIQPNMPRFVRVGDKAQITARIFNTGETAAAGTARMELIDPDTERVVYSRQTAFEVGAGQTGMATFEYSPADNSCPLLICRITASGRTFSDGEQHYLPVLPDRERVTVTVPFTQNGPGVKTVSLSDIFAVRDNTARLTVEYTNNPAWMMVQALPQLVTPRDNNAIDQATALYANAIAADIIKSNPKMKGVFERWQMERGTETSLMSSLEKNASLKDIVLAETPWVVEAGREAEQKQALAGLFNTSMVQQRLTAAADKLKQLQRQDGSWSWCPGMDGSLYITVEVAEMLVRLNAMTGQQVVTDAMLDKAFGYMDRQMVKEVDEMKKAERKGVKPAFPGTTALTYLYLCAIDSRSHTTSAKSAADYLIALLKKDITGQTIYDKALTAIILARHGETLKSREYVQSLKEYTVYKEDMGRYYDTPRAAYSWCDYRIPTEVAAIEAIMTVTPEDAGTVDEMRRWLLQQKRTQTWTTPVNSVNAIYAFLVGNRKVLEVQEQTALAIDGKALDLPQATAAMGYVKTVIDRPEGRTFTATKTSEGTSWGALYAQFMQKTSDIEASGSEIDVKREMFLRRADGSVVPLTAKVQPAVGDRVMVRITVKAARDLDFVQIIDRRAACMEPVEQLSGYRNGAYISPKDNATTYCFDRMAKGKHVIETDYHIDRAGTYDTGTCTAGCTYVPEFRATAKSATLTVK